MMCEKCLFFYSRFYQDGDLLQECLLGREQFEYQNGCNLSEKDIPKYERKLEKDLQAEGHKLNYIMRKKGWIE